MQSKSHRKIALQTVVRAFGGGQKIKLLVERDKEVRARLLR